MRNRFILATALGAFSSPGYACLPPVAVFDTAANTAELISPDQARLSAIERVFGPAPNPNSVLVMDVSGKSGSWQETGNALALMITTGADYFTYSGAKECIPPDLPVILKLPPGKPVAAPEELFPEGRPPGPSPVDLFPDAPDQGLQPRSGLWLARLGETRLEGCPALMQQYFPQTPGALPAEWKAPRRLDFKAPFHPDQLELSRRLSAEGLSSLRWRNAGKNAWQTEVFSEIFAKIPGDQGRNSQINWSLKVRSEREIEHVTTMHIALPAEAAAVMGNVSDCRMTSINSWVRVGD